MQPNRDILKQILSGVLDPDQAAALLRASMPGLSVFPLYSEQTGLYSLEGETGLTADQLADRTKGKQVFLTRIRYCAFPLAYSEKEIYERDNLR